MQRRVSRKSRGRQAPAKTREPLAEGIIPLRGNGQRDWSSMSDDELMDFAKKFMKQNKISVRRRLCEADRGLHEILRKRKLLDKVGFEERKRKQRGWISLSDAQLLEHARQFMKENEISSSTELWKADSGLYTALQRRKLLNNVGFEKKRRPTGFFSRMSDDELVAFANKFMKENGISGRYELSKADSGLYYALCTRKLLDKVGFKDKCRKKRRWRDMNDDEVVTFAKKFMKESKINIKSKLEKADSGLYEILRKRKLLDRVGFEERMGKKRDWESFSDGQLVEHARQFMEEKGIRGRAELEKADKGLYQALRRRKLLDKVGFEEIRRDWDSLSDKQLLEHARQFMKENGISSSKGLKKADSGLYEVLRKRKLLDKVGFEEKLRKWSLFSDAQLLEHARKFIEENGISGRWELQKADKGLYGALRKRKLLDRVFADIEQAKEKEEAQALFDGLAEFGAS